MDSFRCSLMFHKEVEISTHVVAKGGERFACGTNERVCCRSLAEFYKSSKDKENGEETEIH